MVGHYCYVKDCYLSKSSKHRFPDPEKDLERFKKWILLCSNKELQERTPGNIYANCRICADHFLPSDFARNNVLSKTAIPSLKLPDSVQNVTKLVAEPIPEPGSLQRHRPEDGNCSKNLHNIDDSEPVETPSDELEIKIETIDLVDDISDVQLNLQQKEVTVISNTGNVPPTVLQHVPIQSKTLKKRPIILRKVVNPSKKFLAQIKQHNIKYITCNITEPLKKNVGPSTSKITTLQPIHQVIPEESFISATAEEQKRSKEDTGSQIIDTNVSQDVHEKINLSNLKPNTATTNDVMLENAKINIPNNLNLCNVKYCSGKPPHYFRIPNDEKILRIWRHSLTGSNLRIGDLICDQHFIEEDILNRPNDSNIGTLKEHAVPSLRKVLPGCCIPQCANQNKNTPNMYAIPIWGYYTPWLNCIGQVKLKIESLYDLQQFRVCEQHFPERNLGISFDRMVPTLNLPSKKWYEEKLENYLHCREPNLKNLGNADEAPGIRERSNMVEGSTKGGINEEYCAYSGCSLNKENSYFKFYTFPSEYDRALHWIEACNRPDIMNLTSDEIRRFITYSIGVCFQHKNEIDKKIRLKEKQIDTEKSRNEAPKLLNALREKTEGRKNEPTIIKEKRKSIHRTTDTPNKKTYVPTKDYCAFVNCSTFIKDPVKKYRFPADQELLAQWVEAAGILTKLPGDTIRTLFVCGKHFSISQYSKLGTLILSSVPAHHIEFVDTTSHEGNEHWIMKQTQTQKKNVPTLPEPPQVSSNINVVTKKQNKIELGNSSSSDKGPKVFDDMPVVETKCAVKHCLSNKTTHTLYSFPDLVRDLTKRILWIKAVENTATVTPTLLNVYKNKKICDRHFAKRYLIEGGLLRKDAIPTINLVKEIPVKKEDTDVEWKECSNVALDTDMSIQRTAYIKGNCILRENSIEFPNIRRELRFGKACPRLQKNKFPYKLFRMAARKGRFLESISPGHKLQIHTAIIVDDDDESEKEAMSMMAKIIKRNAEVIPKRRSRGKRPRTEDT